MFRPSLYEVNSLFQEHQFKEEIVQIQEMSGTTAGLVFKLKTKKDHKYILKYDDPDTIHVVEQFFNIYKDLELFPKVLLTAQDKSYMIYTYLEGITHVNRGFKKDWLKTIVIDLLNHYVTCRETAQSWREFNELGIEEARLNAGNLLTIDDYNYVKSKAHQLFNEDSEQETMYLLHGDAGVHNFIFNDAALIGVIDPSPNVGPLIYDFLYAFCSSPDDLNTETLFTVFGYLEQGRIEKSRLIEEVMIQLYCRIGLCAKHHPNDLNDYLEAWEHWKQLCKEQDAGICII